MVGVLAALLCPSKTLTTHHPLKYTYISLYPLHSEKHRQGREAMASVPCWWQSQALHTGRASFPNSFCSLSSHKPHSQERPPWAWCPAPGDHSHHIGLGSLRRKCMGCRLP